MAKKTYIKSTVGPDKVETRRSCNKRQQQQKTDWPHCRIRCASSESADKDQEDARGENVRYRLDKQGPTVGKQGLPAHARVAGKIITQE